MKITKHDLTLYAVNLLKGEDDSKSDYTKEQAAKALNLTVNTLNLYLTNLTTGGDITRIKRKNIKDFLNYIRFTEKGKKKIESIDDDINNLMLTPEKHGITHCVNVSDIIGGVNDPLTKISILAMLTRTIRFDLSLLLYSSQVINYDYNLKFLMEFNEDSSFDRGEFLQDYLQTSFLGDIDRVPDGPLDFTRMDINTLLVTAESRKREGKLQDSLQIYDMLLSDRYKLPQNQWFIASKGRVHIFRKLGNLDKALNEIERIISNILDKQLLSILCGIKAQIHFYLGNIRRSDELYGSCIRSFRAIGPPIFLAMLHNDRGTAYFAREMYQKAEKDFLRAREYAKKAGSRYYEAIVLPNIADILMKKGKYPMAKRYLDDAEGIFTSMNDREGIATVEFNRSLLCLEEGDFRKALMYYNKSLTTAYPLPSPHERKERMDEFIKRAKEKGFELSDANIRDDYKIACKII